MTAIAYYLLKMLICSGILTGYYYASLQNKLFHQWNRFYLLLTAVFSITFPLLYIPVFDFSPASNTVGQMVYKVSASELLLLKHQPQTLSFFELITYGAYSSVVFVFMLLLFVSLYKIYSLKLRSTFIRQNDINIYQTNAHQAPFSFFKNIFWKQSIDIQSIEGQQILTHELVHVHEKHSADKVFMQLVLSFLWINPFFWLIKKELTMIHEFIADKKSVGNNDASVLASLILTTAYSSGRFDITNQFFQSSIKRRITMITQNKDPRFSYLRRIAALFVLLTTLGMIAFRSKNANETSVINPGKDTTIIPERVLDLDWFKNSDTSTIIFTVDKKRVNYADVKDLSTDKVEDVHSYTETRNGNNVIMVDLTMVDPKRKGSVSLAWKRNLDNCIYLIDGKEAKKGDMDKVDPNTIESITVWNSKDALERFGYPGKSGVIEMRLKKPTQPTIVKDDVIKIAVTSKTDKDGSKQIQMRTVNATDTGKFVLNFSEMKNFGANTNEIASINADHYFGESKSPLYIVDGKEVADLKGIDARKIESISVWKDSKAIQQYGEKGRNGVVEVVLKKTGKPYVIKQDVNPARIVNDSLPKVASGKLSQPMPDNGDIEHPFNASTALFIIEGKDATKADLAKLNIDSIESMSIWKGEKAIEKYGEKGKNGVVEIALKKTTKPATLIP
jgi:hypothetical protein